MQNIQNQWLFNFLNHESSLLFNTGGANICSGLESELKAGRPAMIIMQGNNGLQGSHAVVAIGYVESPTTVVFNTADSNFPDNPQTMTYDKNAQTWDYYWNDSTYWSKLQTLYPNKWRGSYPNWSLGVGYFPSDGIRVGTLDSLVTQLINSLVPTPVVQSVTPSQTSVAVNQTFPVTLTVTNTGPSSGNFDIQLVDTAWTAVLGGGWTVTTPVQQNQNFSGYQAQTFTFNVTATSEGKHSFNGQARISGHILWDGSSVQSGNVVASTSASTSSQSPFTSSEITPGEPAAPLPPTPPTGPNSP